MPKKIFSSILPELQNLPILTRIYDFFKIIITPPKPGSINNNNTKESKENDLEEPLMKKVDSFELIKFSN
jgi:hypothetical protein